MHATRGHGMKKTAAVVLAAATGLTLALVGTQTSRAGHADDGDGEGATVRNSIAFHLVDFIGWNNRDWNVMRHLHTADVKVDIAGQHTEGVEPHIAMLQQFIQADPSSLIVKHTPIVAAGKWTCTVGITSAGGALATAAKWRNGAIAEEYLFLAPLPAGTPRPALAGSPLVNISNSPRDRALFDIAGATPGWSCLVDRAPDGRRVAIFTQRNGNTVVQESIFNEY
jgi:hypothetical protein